MYESYLPAGRGLVFRHSIAVKVHAPMVSPYSGTFRWFCKPQSSIQNKVTEPWRHPLWNALTVKGPGNRDYSTWLVL